MFGVLHVFSVFFSLSVFFSFFRHPQPLGVFELMVLKYLKTFKKQLLEGLGLVFWFGCGLILSCSWGCF